MLVFSHRLYRRIALRTRRSCCCMPSLSARADAVRTRHWQVLQNWRAFRQMFNEPTVQNRNDDCAFERVSNGGKGIRIPGLATIGCCTAGDEELKPKPAIGVGRAFNHAIWLGARMLLIRLGQLHLRFEILGGVKTRHETHSRISRDLLVHRATSTGSPDHRSRLTPTLSPREWQPRQFRLQ